MSPLKNASKIGSHLRSHPKPSPQQALINSKMDNLCFLSPCTQALWSWRRGRVVESWQSAVCGAFAGARDHTVLGKTEVGGVSMLAVRNSVLQAFQLLR